MTIFMVVLITTVFKGSAVIQAIKLFSPQRVYFLIDEPLNEIRNQTINMIKEFFPTLDFKSISAKVYNIVDIAKETIDIIEKEKNEEIIIHVSEGRKTMGFGLLFGAYMMSEHVKAAYYLEEETNPPIQLPLTKLKVPDQKRKLLDLIFQGINDVKDIEKRLEITASTVYVHMKELRDEGFLDKDNKITDIGKIVLLRRD